MPPPSGPAVRVGDGPLHVVSSTAEQMFLDIGPDQTAKLPRYKGDLLLIEHSAGSLTSQAYMKRWNRQNEVLAGAAEHAAVAAAWLGGRPYPRARLNAAWTLVMGGQFHDILPGTSIPKAYKYSWNDEVLAMNQFAEVATSASAAVASALDTRAEGTPVVVYNPLDVAREDVVEASVPFAGGAPRAVRVVGADGKDVPAQIERDHGGVRGPGAVGRLCGVRRAAGRRARRRGTAGGDDSSIENARYRIAIDRHGDIASLFDKTLGKELLAAPARLALTTDQPVDWPAWNIDWADAKKPPRAYVGGPAAVRIVERGPARVALEVSRKAEGSTFVQTIRLAAGGAGDRVEIANAIDWRTKAANLKATFPLTASNPLATYNWDVGTIQRGNDDERKYEVPSHQWVDLTDAGGGYGVTVLTDCKNGSDKPDDRTLRLTLLRTPGIGTGNGRYYSDQATQDWGRHTFVYGLAAHAGDWREGRTNRQALRLNEPLMAFVTAPHDGPLGRTFSLVTISSPHVRLLALKKAEESDEIVVRLVETDGRPAMPVHVSFGADIRTAREIDAAERGPSAPVNHGALVRDLTTTLGPYQLRTFAITLGPAPATVMPPTFGAVALPYDRTVSTADGATTPEGFAGGASLPAEMLPATLPYAGVAFALAPSTGGAPDAVVPRGQAIALPEGQWDRVYVLAASADGDRRVTFRVGDRAEDVTIEDWGGYVGQWDNRTWRARRKMSGRCSSTPASHPGSSNARRSPGSRRTITTRPGATSRYGYAYLFAYALDVPPGARTLTLPSDGAVRILGGHRRARRRRGAAGAPAVRHAGALASGAASARMPASATMAMWSAISSMCRGESRKSGASRSVTGLGWQKRHSAWMPATTRVTRGSRGGRPMSSLTSVRR